MKQPPTIVDFANITPVPCPCGQARRAFAETDSFPGTLHRTEITADAQRHYHKRLTETYYILECGRDAVLELDEERVPLKPGMAIHIPPYTRHRAVGAMQVLIICVPNFDPADEWFD